jgi:predicted nucleic acid-binding protein
VRYFVDTSFYAALIDRRDRLHARAVALVRRLGQVPTNTNYTTEAVLIELLTFFSNRGPHLRQEAAAFVENLRASSPTIIIPQTPALFDAAFDLYRSRNDKTYSMVDGIGMVVCRQQAITTVLTADQDFLHEGLAVLLP